MKQKFLIISRNIFAGHLAIATCLFLHVEIMKYSTHAYGNYKWEQVYDFKSLAFLHLLLNGTILSSYSAISFAFSFSTIKMNNFMIKSIATAVFASLIYSVLFSDEAAYILESGLFWGLYALFVLIVAKMFSEIINFYLKTAKT